MKFYIVTPSFNSRPYLSACLHSVLDQASPTLFIHHHIQDANSSDGTLEFLQAWHRKSLSFPHYHFSFISSPDEGMYDALNHAWDIMPDDCDLTAQLNSDEQYLAHALSMLAAYYVRFPTADVLLGSYVIVDAQLRYICHRRPVMPRLWSSWLQCACITNSSFFRASTFRTKHLRFPLPWRSIGDLIFYRLLLEQGLRFQTIPCLSSLFMCTGHNLAWSPITQDELSRFRPHVPLYARVADPLIKRWVNGQRRLTDFFSTAPLYFDAYHHEETFRRITPILSPTCRWNARQCS